VKANRIGLVGTFPEEALLRYLLFRVHDLFDYNQGSEGERLKIGEAADQRGTRARGREVGVPLPGAEERGFHAYDSPNGTLFKYSTGSCTRTRSIRRGSWRAILRQQKGLLGECIALIHTSRKTPRGWNHQRGGGAPCRERAARRAAWFRSDVLELPNEIGGDSVPRNDAFSLFIVAALLLAASGA